MGADATQRSPLFIDETHPFVRARALQPDTAQELVPLRLLVVEGSRDAALGTSDELGGIIAALPAFGGRIEPEVLSEPSETELWEAFMRVRPHVLHFAGHGFVDDYSEPGGASRW